MPWTTAPHTSGGDTEMMADDSARPATRGPRWPRRPRAGLPLARPALAGPALAGPPLASAGGPPPGDPPGIRLA
ncbi:hypothetical protein ACFVBJ_30920, partial [Streptomyces sp. NPDC057676]